MKKKYYNFLIIKDTEIMKISNQSENKALHTHYIKYATELFIFSRKENNEIFSKPSLRLSSIFLIAAERLSEQMLTF